MGYLDAALANKTSGWSSPLPGDSTSTRSAPKKSSGGLFGIHLPNLGLGEIISLPGSLLTAGARLSASLLPGGEPAGKVASQFGKGMLSSFAGTGLNALDVASLGTLHGQVDELRDQWGNLLAGQGDSATYRPLSLMEAYNQHGLLPVAGEQIGNLAPAASLAGKIAKLGELGMVAEAAAAATRATSAGFTEEAIAQAAEAAKAGRAGFREAGISSDVLKTAGKAAAKAEGLGETLTPEAVASRARLLDVLHNVSHPYRSMFDRGIRPLGQAATERLVGGAQGVAEAAAVPAEGAAVAEASSVAEKVKAGVGATQEAAAPVSPHDALAAAMEQAVAAADAGKLHDPAQAILDSRRAAAMQGVPPADRVTLYRGEPGAYDPANPLTTGPHWTEKRSYAQSQAGPSGHVLETVVPKDVAARAQQEGVTAGHFADSKGSHLLPTYWADLARPVEGSAAAAAEPAATIASRFATNVEPASAAAHAATIADALAAKGEPVATALGAEARNTLGLTRTAVGPIQEAIQRAAEAPRPAWADKAVAKMPDAVVRALSKTDRFIAARQTGMVLKERLRMQDINRREILNSDAIRTPQLAARKFLVGEVLPDGTKITPEISDGLIGDELIARIDLTSAVEDVVARHATPAAMKDVRAKLVDIGARDEKSIPQEWLRDAEGAPTELGTIVEHSVEALRNAATERTNILLEGTKGDKGLTHIADSMPALSPRAQKLMASVTEDLRTVAKLEASKIPAERIRAAKEMARIQADLKEVSVELAGAHAEAKAASEAFDVTRSPVKDGIIGRYNAAKEGFRESPLAGERTAPTPLQRAQSTPDVGGLTEHGAYRRGIEGGRAVEGIRAAAQKAVELERRKAELAKNLDDIKRSMIEHTLPSELVRDKLSGRAERRLTAVARQMEHPSLAGVPAQWKPMWDSIAKLHEEAAYKPDLQEALKEIPNTWNTVLRIAAEQGFDPVHVRSFQPSEIRRLVHDSVSLGHRGRDLGQTIEAGTRKTRRMAQARTRSLSALAAGIAEATHESHTNALAKFIEDTWARPVVDGVVPEHGVGWDAERSFLLTGEKMANGGTSVVGLGAPTKWIPREVKAVLDAYRKDYHHGSFEFIRKATDPWRLFVLTLSPRWYVNNFAGNVVLAAKEGVSFQDFTAAWREFRKGGPDLTRNKFLQKFGAGTESFKDVSGAVAGGLRSELAPESLIQYSHGMEGFRQARQTGGMAEVGRLVQHRLNRANEVVDEMARVSVYKSQLRRGATEAHALNRVYAAMVDYNDMSPFERQFVRSVVPFYAWQKAMLKIAAKFPIDNPQVVGIMLALEKVNRDLAADQYGGDVPEYYRGIVPIPGIGNVNTRAFNPLADAGSLSSPQGIAAAVNPFVSIAVRNALGAPDGASYQRTDQFGRRVSDTSPAQDITDMLGGLPQFRVGQALTGTSISGREQKLGPAAGGYLGLRTYSNADVQAMVDRMAEARKAAKKKQPAHS